MSLAYHHGVRPTPLYKSIRAVAAFLTLIGPFGVALCDELALPVGEPTAASLLVKRVFAAYVEPFSDRRLGRGLRVVFIGGPRLTARPGVFFGSRPEGLFPPDLTGAEEISLRVYNASPFPLSLEIELRCRARSFERQAMVSAGHWRHVTIDLDRVRRQGIDLGAVEGLAIRPVARYKSQVVEIVLQKVVVRWPSAVPRQPAVAVRSLPRGPAASLPPELRRQGWVKWKGMQVPVVAECDVAVAGGGLAGVAAAVSAARAGVRTILIERTGAVGGMATSGFVPPALRPDLAGGIVQEFLDRLARRGGDQQKTSPEVMKAVLL